MTEVGIRGTILEAPNDQNGHLKQSRKSNKKMKTIKRGTSDNVGVVVFEYVPVCQIEHRGKSSEVLIDLRVSESLYSQV